MVDETAKRQAMLRKDLESVMVFTVWVVTMMGV
jgi:hypothetical protein